MLYIVLDSPSGYKTIEDFAKLVYNFLQEGVLVLINPQGNALFQGLPILSKIALSKNKTFFVFQTLKDFLETVKLDKVYLIDNKSEKSIDYNEFKNVKERNIALIFTEFKTKESIENLECIEKVKGIEADLTLSCEAAIIISKIKEIYEG